MLETPKSTVGISTAPILQFSRFIFLKKVLNRSTHKNQIPDTYDTQKWMFKRATFYSEIN